MQIQNKKKIAYCIPALYLAGGMERVLTIKANYLSDHYGYDITIILTDGIGKPFFYPLSPKIKVINLNLNFEDLWNSSFIKKTILYIQKQYQYKKELSKVLLQLKPDFTISLLRREINFINSIKDGSYKIGEIHINKDHYRTFEENDTNYIKKFFSYYWKRSLVKKLQKLDSFVVLTDNDKKAWKELNNVRVIPNPLSFSPSKVSQQTEKRVIAVGRYCHEKGYDDLLKAWSMIQNDCPDWTLSIYGDGDRTYYNHIIAKLGIDNRRCILNEKTSDIESEYCNSSISVCSSRFEGFGLVIAEAMACGLPVVSYDCPWGPRSIITNEVDGILVENRNIKKLANGILRLIKDSDTRALMGKNAIVNIQRFNIESIAKQWIELFNNLSYKS